MQGLIRLINSWVLIITYYLFISHGYLTFPPFALIAFLFAGSPSRGYIA